MAVAPPLPRIHRLPESVSNQIAAGEVIERPASVVKELVENSLDAGATEIVVEVVRGGKELIRVRDNGHGIHPRDLPLALTSHATSKLADISDLACINSLGFRGEALPSIASVSRFRLSSRARDFDQGWVLSMDTGAAGECLPAAHPQGTTVEVQHLFHNIPARRKFMRSDQTEYLHILEVIRSLALGRPSISLRMQHNGKQVFFSLAAGADALPARVEQIMGRAFTRAALPADYQVRDLRLSGWLGHPDRHRSQTDRQYFYLNGRMIRDRQVNHAIRTAYGDGVPAGRYPEYLLYLEMDPAAADVNVHPTKHEVRFREAWNVHDFIFAGVRQALEARTQADAGAIRERGAAYSAAAVPALVAKGAATTPAAGCTLGLPRYCLSGRYILAQRGSELLLIDARAVRARLLRTRLASVSEEQPLTSRPLLVPVDREIEPGQALIVETHDAVLARYGLNLQLLSPLCVRVCALPALLAHADLNALLPPLLAGLQRAGQEHEEVEACIKSVYADCVPAFTVADPDVNEMLVLLRALEQDGIDTGAAHHDGLWHSLDAASINALIQYGSGAGARGEPEA